MIAAESGMNSVDLLEPVGEACGGQLIRAEPAAQVGEGCRDYRESDSNKS
jgi:hypothetical protein